MGKSATFGLGWLVPEWVTPYPHVLAKASSTLAETTLSIYILHSNPLLSFPLATLSSPPHFHSSHAAHTAT